jgi:DNA repair exonuclease SbcCD ATPase subunit
MIWLLEKVGLVHGLRTVPEEKILKAEVREHERQLEAKLQATPVADSFHAMVESARNQMNEALLCWEELLAEYRAVLAGKKEISRREMAELQNQVQEAAAEFRKSMRAWLDTWQVIPMAQGA